MKRLFLIVLFAPVFAGLSSSPGRPCLPCEAYYDSLDTSILRDSIRAWVSVPVDSFRAVKERKIDSLTGVRDSLAQVLQQLCAKKVIRLGEVDTVKSVHETWLWRWYYWIFPGGEKRFYKATKHRIK